MARSSSSNRAEGQSSTRSRAKAGAMTPQEAGRLGGLKGGKAPHKCRGFECQKQNRD
jgi:hypothetical protein